MININKLAKQIHSNNKKKGFWSKKRNEGEVLFLVITELAEICEAHRRGRYCQRHVLEVLNSVPRKRKKQFFEENIKDTIGDELADAFIRMCDYCIGFKKIIYEGQIKSVSAGLISTRVFENLGEELLGVSSLIGRASDCSSWEISLIFAYMIWIADKLNIPLEAHIKYKMWYNSTRPKMHGKKY